MPAAPPVNPISDALFEKGLRQDEDVMIRRRDPAYIDEELFYEYISSVFCPYLQDVRNKLGAEEEMAVLLMDSCKPHCSQRVLRLLGENRVLAIVFPSHTTNLFQMLDLSFFGVLKHLKATAEGDFDDESVNEQITKLLQAYEQTATSMNVRGSFARAGLHPVVTSKPFKIRFIEEEVRKNPGFLELWEKNFSVAELSRRRQLQVFGVINSQYLPAE
jgi:hypothetical protein